ncbi:MAG: sulfatase [Microlunatus sp.]|nr:sulfatase [Microlunatus sp.]
MSSTTPNIVLIHCHDLGRRLGLYGAATVNSPQLDAFAADAVVADRMFCSAPQCSPSRSSLFTGRWPHSNGVLGLTHDGFGWDLHADERHLAGWLSGAGYRTELIGMHHESRTGADRDVAQRLGFDRVDTGGLADEIVAKTDAALDRLGAAGGPFYLQVGFTEPHRLPGARDAPGVMGFLGDHIEPDDSSGVQVPGWLVDEASAREEIAELQGAIRLMDSGVGRVLRKLDDLGLTEDTITIFTTDHGLALPRAKCSLYDPGLEIAFAARWPAGGWTGGVRLDQLLVNLDVLPTLLDAIGIDAGSADIQGRSFLPLLTGQPADYPARDAIFAELTYHDYYDPRRSIRTRRHKLIMNFSSAPVFMDPSQSWARRCTPALSVNGNLGSHPSVELYDLESDPYELHDLAGDPAQAGVRQELLARLGDWMQSTGDPLLDGAVTSPLHRKSLELLP